MQWRGVQERDSKNVSGVCVNVFEMYVYTHIYTLRLVNKSRVHIWVQATNSDFVENMIPSPMRTRLYNYSNMARFTQSSFELLSA